MRLASVLLLFALSIQKTHTSVPQNDGSGFCCLCECQSKAQDKCAHYCIRKQNGKDIVNESEIKTCTYLCKAKFSHMK
jgi:hypothetical protein